MFAADIASKNLDLYFNSESTSEYISLQTFKARAVKPCTRGLLANPLSSLQMLYVDRPANLLQTKLLFSEICSQVAGDTFTG